MTELDDRAEVDLMHRLTALEHWQSGVEEALGLLGIGLIAMAIAATLLTLVLRKKRP